MLGETTSCSSLKVRSHSGQASGGDGGETGGNGGNWLLLAEALKDRDELSLEVVRGQEVMVGVLLRKQAGLCLQLKIGADGETEFKNELLPCP